MVDLRSKFLHFIGLNDWKKSLNKDFAQNALELKDCMVGEAQKSAHILERNYGALLMELITSKSSQINQIF